MPLANMIPGSVSKLSKIAGKQGEIPKDRVGAIVLGALKGDSSSIAKNFKTVCFINILHKMENLIWVHIFR